MEQLKIEEVLISWNSWWKGEKIESFPRKEYVDNIISWLGKGKSISLYGIRRCGKTTITKQVVYKLISKGKKPGECCYINFEDERFYAELENPEIIEKIYQTFLSLKNPKKRVLLILDEVQNINGWEKWVRRIIEQKENIDIIVTGSSAALLSSDLATTLTGRTIPIEVKPLTFKEFLTFRGINVPKISNVKEAYLKLKKHEFQNALREYIEIGGMPELVLEESKEKRMQIAKTYFSDILFRDIVKRYNIKESKLLEEIALYCLTNSSDYVSFNKLAKTLKASINTIKQHVDYLEKAFLIKIVPQFSYSVKAQQHADRIKKVYCMDNGLRNLVSFKFSKDLGKMAENTAFVNISKEEAKIFTWKENKEVDLIKYKGKGIEAINVCFGEIKDREYTGLKEFKKKYKKAKLTLLTLDKFGEKDGITLVPLWLFLLSI